MTLDTRQVVTLVSRCELKFIYMNKNAGATGRRRDVTPTRLAAFSGIYPMQYAFFHDDGTLDRNAMLRQVEGCLAGGADGIAVLGLGTEVNKLSLAERTEILEWTVDSVGAAGEAAFHLPQ
ncbi:MAG: hypothetical protein EON59_04790, partial [Alphaproteobacteria bacterium]